ncbi:MAG: hemerythrin domain-containing protein [Actinomycetota bacterium]|nr:hemerythrin domain-containing protein [Actinomycetota bacterium]MDQ6947639.1 hemerythrin domain-containing protein [Actinomycetota bacterium]
MSDPIDQLTGDHSKVKRLFNQWSHLGGTEPGMETALAITGLLKVHTTLEEELVYPVLRRFDDGLATEAEHEHAQAGEIIASIEAMPADSGQTVHETHDRRPGMVDAMGLLETAVLHHVEEEESVIFPKLQASCSAEELDTMGHAMYARRQQLLGAEDQGATETQIGNTGMGAPKI